MADGTHIEWTDATWNPVTGCAVVSPGCTHCYAMKLAGTRLKHHPTRAGLTVDSKAGPVWTGEVRLNEQWLDQPLRWKRPRRIFVCAHGDLFAENVPDEWIDKVFAIMALAPQHTFQVLTKRAARMRQYINGAPSQIPYLGRMPLERIHLEAAGHMEGDGGLMDTLKRHGNIYSLYCSVPWPLPNVWLGVSAERQQEADERVPELLATPAAVRFVSAEPLLGPIQFDDFCNGHKFIDALRGNWWHDDPDGPNPISRGHEKLDWVIVGGESGDGARPMHPSWARSIRDQCASAGVPFFFKQWGNWVSVYDRDRDYPDWRRVPRPGDWDRKRWLNLAGGQGFHGDALNMMRNVGKRRAGRLLDGVEHNAMPQVREVPAP